jgi:hypothetical protein
MTRKEYASVLELQAVPADIVGCFGQPAALDWLASNGHGGRRLRVAPNELLVFAVRARLAELESELSALDPTSLVVDLSSAFSIWALRGEDRFEAFCRLSEIELLDPPSVLQGLFARVPAKVLALEDELLVIVSSALSHRIRERVMHACADLAPAETAARTTEPAEEVALA